MRLPRLDWLSLGVLAAILAVGCVACARWPVTEDSSTPPPGFPGVATTVPPTGGTTVAATMTYRYIRPPTLGEWSVRVGIFSAAILLACAAWAAGQRLEKYLK